jgi:redox-sensitive bicupin YhaK (pirin superfamily)
MRKVLGVYSAPRPHWVGDGFPVWSLFSHASHGDDVSPFVLFDYAGPIEFPPADELRGVGTRPHRGFETVTIVRDSTVQLWVKPPANHKNTAPAYQTLLKQDIPSVQLPNRAEMLRVIAGEYEAHHGPAHTTSIDLWDLRLNQGGLASFVLPEGRTVLVVAPKGTVQVNGSAIAREVQLVLLDRRGGEIAA